MRIQLYTPAGMAEFLLAPSDLTQLVELAQTAMAHAAERKLQDSAMGPGNGPNSFLIR